MTKEVRYCVGDPTKDIIMKSCEECSVQSKCQGHTDYIVKWLPLIITSVEGE